MERGVNQLRCSPVFMVDLLVGYEGLQSHLHFSRLHAAATNSATLHSSAISPSTKRAETDQVSKNLYDKTEEADQKVVEQVQKLAESQGIPTAQIVLAWVLSQPTVTASIIGTSKLRLQFYFIFSCLK